MTEHMASFPVLSCMLLAPVAGILILLFLKEEQGFLVRTARGRMVTRASYLHFGLKPPERATATLQMFEDPR